MFWLEINILLVKFQHILTKENFRPPKFAFLSFNFRTIKHILNLFRQERENKEPTWIIFIAKGFWSVEVLGTSACVRKPKHGGISQRKWSFILYQTFSHAFSNEDLRFVVKLWWNQLWLPFGQWFSNRRQKIENEVLMHESWASVSSQVWLP